MPGTTSEGVIFPVIGDVIPPLNGWFAQLASSTNAALVDLRNDLTQAALPNPVSGQGADTQAVTATSWADLPNGPTLTLTLSQACWVQITHSAWMRSTTGDIRLSSAVSGATTLAENQLQVGGTNTAWGQVLYANATTSTNQGSGVRIVRLNAGTNTIKLRAYLVGAGGTRQANYSTLQVAPLRWA